MNIEARVHAMRIEPGLNGSLAAEKNVATLQVGMEIRRSLRAAA